MQSLEIVLCRPRERVVTAARLKPENLEAVESWCRGSIKGIKLPRNKRCVDIQTDEGEVRVEMGDWVVYDPATNSFQKLSETEFRQQYEAQ